MKKLNITKKQYDESKYFNKKYGAIKFVSESGKHYKTDKGVVLALEGTEEPMKEDGDSIMDRQLDGNEEADKKDGGDNEGGDITRGELTDMLKDVVKEVEKVCDAQDLSFEEVAGIEKPEGESDEEADKDEVVATKDEVAEVLAGVIDTVEKVADQNDIELPEEEEDDGEDADKDGDDGDVNADDPEKEDECTVTETADGCDDVLKKVRDILKSDELSADAMVAEIGELVGQADESCDCGKKGCPDCNPDVVKGECGGKENKFMEARKARRAKLVREAVRRLRAKKVRESVVRRAKVRKVLESIRKRRLAKKVMESIRRRRAEKKVMESRKNRVLEARKDRKVMESIRARRAARMRRLAK